MDNWKEASLLPYLEFDQYCDLLSAASWEHVYERWSAAELTPERQAEIFPLVQNFSQSRQFLFADDPRSLALEIFWLKWNLFSSLCRRLLVFHTDNQRPHLALQPAHVRLRFPTAIEYWCPARWLYSLELVDAIAPPCSQDVPLDLAKSLFLPPPNLSPLYTSPAIRDWTFGRKETVTALIRSLEQIHEKPDEAVRGLVRLHVLSDNISSADFSDRDIFSLVLHTSSDEFASCRIWGQKTGHADRGFVLSGTIPPLSPALWKSLEKNTGRVFSGSSLTIYKSFHVPCDLYSLGMMLSRALFVNEEQSIGQVERALRKVVNGLEPLVQGIETNDSKMLMTRLGPRLKEHGPIFAKSVLTGRGGESLPSNGFFDELWQEAILLTLRLLSSIPGFSICGHAGDYDARTPQNRMREVVRLCDILSCRIRVELFGSRQRNREILEACDLIGAGAANIGNG